MFDSDLFSEGNLELNNRTLKFYYLTLSGNYNLALENNIEAVEFLQSMSTSGKFICLHKCSDTKKSVMVEKLNTNALKKKIPFIPHFEDI